MTTLILQQHSFTTLFVNKMQKAMTILHLWGERYHQRKQLAKLDARLLRDIGLDFDRVKVEISKPFWK